MNEWTKERITKLIADGVEESLQLEYKRANSLGKQNDNRVEITKDISAMANSSGGIIVYGVAEFQEKTKRHLPERLDPIERSVFTREWLEQIINTIQPRINATVVHSVDDNDSPGYGYYVVEIPQSNTAHQARDHRYYKRFNFQAVPMEDYEIRDIMNRRKHPHVVLEFKIRRYIETPDMVPAFMAKRDAKEIISLEAYGKNTGLVFAQYVEASIWLPRYIVDAQEMVWAGYRKLEQIPAEMLFEGSNLKGEYGPMGNKLGEKRYEPLLPGREMFVTKVRLSNRAFEEKTRELQFSWRTHADNSAPIDGRTQISTIEVEDQRGE